MTEEWAGSPPLLQVIWWRENLLLLLSHKSQEELKVEKWASVSWEVNEERQTHERDDVRVRDGWSRGWRWKKSWLLVTLNPHFVSVVSEKARLRCDCEHFYAFAKEIFTCFWKSCWLHFDIRCSSFLLLRINGCEDFCVGGELQGKVLYRDFLIRQLLFWGGFIATPTATHTWGCEDERELSLAQITS